MRIAAFVFLGATLMYAACFLSMAFFRSEWIHLLFALGVSLAAGYQGYAMLRGRPDAWKGAAAVAAILCVATAVRIAIIVESWPEGELDVPSSLRSTVTALTVISVTFGAAVVAIMVAKRMNPD